MKLYVFAGANGSGKSTLVKSFFKKEKYRHITYICPDNIVRAMPENNLSEEEKYLKAFKIAERERNRLVKEGKPFCLETVLSRYDKVELIAKIKESGYKICIIYITTENPEINKRRVKRRVSEGGHDVPEEKLVNRYYKSLELIPELIKQANEFYIYDNSIDDEKPRLVYCFNDDYIQNPVYEKYIKPYIRK